MKIGFIGLGIMGSRMAGHLLAAGHDLVVYNRSQEKAQALVEKGATLAASPAAAAQDAEILFTMLAHPEAVKAVAYGDEGFLNALPKGHLWVDCSTVKPAFSRTMAREAQASGLRFLEAPVAGSKNQAAGAQLVFIAGGAADDVEICKPLFEVMGSKTLHAGDHGMATSLKLVINYLLANTMIAFSEALVLGEEMGLAQETILNVLVGGPIAAPFLGAKRGNLENGEFEPEFPLKWMQKDLQMASEAAFEVGTAIPVGNAAKEAYRLAARAGHADEDFSAIYQFLKGN